MAKDLSIPFLGKTGLICLVGGLVGVGVDYGLAQAGVEYPDSIGRSLYQGFHVDDLIGFVLPIVLAVLVKRGKFFFVGWFIAQLTTELYEILNHFGGYT